MGNTIRRDAALPVIEYTVLASRLYVGKVDVKMRTRLIKIINGLRLVHMLSSGKGGSVQYLTEYGWFLVWIKTERFQSSDEALKAIEEAANATVIESKKSLLYRLIHFMASRADDAWRLQSRRECEGDD